MLLHKEWGDILRTGNFLFKYASMLGLSKMHNVEVRFPKHYFFDYFKHQLPVDDGIEVDGYIDERVNRYDPEHINSYANDMKTKNMSVRLNCFLQSEKYWMHCKDYVIEMLEFKDELLDKVRNRYEKSLSRKTIGISIRRGDWVGHTFFYQIPIEFYIYNLQKYFPSWRDEYNIVLFSDDPEWLRKTFKGDNVYYVGKEHFLNDNYHNNPFEQVLYGSLCDNFIISNSTFSWWLGYLAVTCKKNDCKVIHSGKWMTDEGSKEFGSTPDDYYPESWTVSDFFTTIPEDYNFKALDAYSLLKG